MKIIFAIVSFFCVLVLELTFVPKVFGIYVPLSFWLAALIFSRMRADEVLIAAFFYGLVFGAARPELREYALLLFFATAAVAIFARRFFEWDGVVRDSIVLAFGVFAFQFLPPFVLLIPDIFGGGGSSLAWPEYSLSLFAKDFLLNIVFVVLAVILLLAVEKYRERKRLVYV